jgi:hypothetical protein
MTKLKNSEKTLFEFESKIGVKDSFFEDLLEEDDWSFIIKLHALFEAVCSHLLLYHLQEPELNDVISRLELSNQSIGKIVFLEKLGFISGEYKRFIIKLSKLRNGLVHNVQNCEFSLDKMVNSLDSKKLKEFAISFSPLEARLRRMAATKNNKLEIKIEPHMQVEYLVKQAKTKPKFHIWMGALNVLGSILDMYGYSDYKQWAKVNPSNEDE